MITEAPTRSFSLSAYHHDFDPEIWFTRDKNDFLNLGFTTGEHVKAVGLLVDEEEHALDCAEIEIAYQAYLRGELTSAQLKMQIHGKLIPHVPDEWIDAPQWLPDPRIENKSSGRLAFHRDGASYWNCYIRVLRVMRGKQTLICPGNPVVRAREDRDYVLDELPPGTIIESAPKNCVLAFTSSLPKGMQLLHSAPAGSPGRLLATATVRGMSLGL